MGRSRGGSSGCGTLPLVLFVVFLACKLAGVIDWSWWWVTAPLWLPPALVVAILLLLTVTGVGVYKLVSRSAKAWVGGSGMKAWTAWRGDEGTKSTQGEGQGDVVIDVEGAEVPATGPDGRAADQSGLPGRQLSGLPAADADETADGSSAGEDRPTV